MTSRRQETASKDLLETVLKAALIRSQNAAKIIIPGGHLATQRDRDIEDLMLD